jgi:hypothetical protein
VPLLLGVDKIFMVTYKARAHCRGTPTLKIPHISLLLASIVAGVAFSVTSAEAATPSLPSAGVHPANIRGIPPSAGPNRPGSVPEGFVITPFGYFHPSCVQSLAQGERVLADGRIQHADGTVAEKAAVCSYPHYTRAGVPSGVSGQKPAEAGSEVTASPEINGWVESASIITGSATEGYGALIATWTVPPQPPSDDGQVLYFFPGLEDINNVESILQPVLGWYQGQWTLASWNCCLNGITTNSPPVAVSPGDEIYGSITNNCVAGTFACATWNVLSLDLNTGESTTLASTPSNGQNFNWAFGAVLEAYYIVKCEDYPWQHRLSFDNITIFDQNLHRLYDRRWTAAVDSQDTPQCHYGVRPRPDRVTLEF